MPSRTSAQINKEIFDTGSIFFELVRENVTNEATRGETPELHQSNRARLVSKIQAIVEGASRPAQDHNGLWQVIWPRIVYAGTLAAKATPEIESMRNLVPLFQDLGNYSPDAYIFDVKEWEAFSKIWKANYLTIAARQKWLQLSKLDANWNPAAHFREAKTSPAVWKLMTKDASEYPGLRFSAKVDKVQKYLSVARFLHDLRLSGNRKPMDFYTNGYVFSNDMVTGQEWLIERDVLELVRSRFSQQIGTLTAMHTMMDLGLKTIKPDRVMTYLFSQLGWLQTLPNTSSKKIVLSHYLDNSVLHEMTVRADVLAASLSANGFQMPHRLLDIWLVKFGQRPEPVYGITRNLQEDGVGIKGILDIALSRLSASSGITESAAATFWPTGEFAVVNAACLG